MGQRFAPVLGPVLGQLPAPSADGIRGAFADDPVKLIQLLLNPAAADVVPAAVRAPLLDGVRVMFTEAIHQVYLVGILICLVGVGVTLCLGNARLKTAAYRPQPGQEVDWGLQ